MQQQKPQIKKLEFNGESRSYCRDNKKGKSFEGVIWLWQEEQDNEKRVFTGKKRIGK